MLHKWKLHVFSVAATPQLSGGLWPKPSLFNIFLSPAASLFEVTLCPSAAVQRTHFLSIDPRPEARCHLGAY